MSTRSSVGAVAVAASIVLCSAAIRSSDAQTQNNPAPTQQTATPSGQNPSLPGIVVTAPKPRRVATRHRVPKPIAAAPTPGAAPGSQTGTGQVPGTGQAAPFSNPLPANIPAVIETVTAQEIQTQTNAITATDTIKYLPSVELRTRYEGEQNSMIGFRTVTEDTPAQSLVYVDGILVSNLLGNYYYYPPVTQMATPNEIARADII
jgi:hypothetical protein